MATDLTIPSDHKELPAIPSSGKTIPVNPQVQQLANTKAVSILKEKARKAGEMTIRFGGLFLNFESATVGQLLGFATNAETWTGNGKQKNWMISEVELTIKGGSSGSQTQLKFQQCVPDIKSP
jgi:hypothetical protein